MVELYKQITQKLAGSGKTLLYNAYFDIDNCKLKYFPEIPKKAGVYYILLLLYGKIDHINLLKVVRFANNEMLFIYRYEPAYDLDPLFNLRLKTAVESYSSPCIWYSNLFGPQFIVMDEKCVDYVTKFIITLIALSLIKVTISVP
jgi:hypothetical protein